MVEISPAKTCFYLYKSAAYVTSIKNLTINAGSEYQIPLAGAVLGISGNLVNNGVIINPNTANGTASTLAMVEV